MRIFAYAAETFAESVRRAAGVEPLTCPPMTAECFDPRWLQGFRFLYIKLHGLAHTPVWYGDNWQPAMTKDQILRADLQGTIIFCPCCQLVDEHTTLTPAAAPMLYALLQAGAVAVLGGVGTNYAAPSAVAGADLLGAAFRRALQAGLSYTTAYRVARGLLSLRHHLKPTWSTADTLGFRLFTPVGPASHAGPERDKPCSCETPEPRP